MQYFMFAITMHLALLNFIRSYTPQSVHVILTAMYVVKVCCTPEIC